MCSWERNGQGHGGLGTHMGSTWLTGAATATFPGAVQMTAQMQREQALSFLQLPTGK